MVIFIENMKYKKRSLLYYQTFRQGRVGKARKIACRRQAEIKQEAGSKQEAGRGLQWLFNPCLVSRN